MVEELITLDRLETHATQLKLGVEAAVNVIAGINPQSLVWLHHTLAAYVMAQDKSKCIFFPWSDADLIIQFTAGVQNQTEFARLIHQLQFGLPKVSRTDAPIDFTVVNPFSNRGSGNRFLKELQKSHRGFLIYENGRTSFPW